MSAMVTRYITCVPPGRYCVSLEDIQEKYSKNTRRWRFHFVVLLGEFKGSYIYDGLTFNYQVSNKIRKKRIFTALGVKYKRRTLELKEVLAATKGRRLVLKVVTKTVYRRGVGKDIKIVEDSDNGYTKFEDWKRSRYTVAIDQPT